jgi:hypothetical protein
MADFDEIADRQGWNDRTMLGLCREFISQAGLQDDLDRFAQEKADAENADASELLGQ